MAVGLRHGVTEGIRINGAEMRCLRNLGGYTRLDK
jgi:hypothetical protein